MSSFKRKTTAKSPAIPAGTRIAPGSSSTLLTSTGVASLDDLLGGGQPLGTTLSLLAPDAHSAISVLCVKYAFAQTLASGQRALVVDGRPGAFVKDCVWLAGCDAGNVPAGTAQEARHDDDAGTNGEADGGKIKIAWRYEGMKQFQTTVPAASAADDFCKAFDLSARVPQEIVDDALRGKALVLCEVAAHQWDEAPVGKILTTIANYLKESPKDVAARICIPALGSLAWGDMSSRDVLQILRAIRILVRQYPHACAVVSLAPHLSSDSWGGPGWTHKVGWLSDGCLTLAAFTADLALSAAFPTHHGLVHLHSLPAPHSLVAPSDRFSALRGLSASGENNLGFRVTRKRLVFETVHLDVEGGVGERRTTPAPVALEHAPHAHAHGHPPELGRAATAIEVSVESAGPTASLLPAPEPQGGGDGAKPKKARKKVAFHADRPDLYDF